MGVGSRLRSVLDVALNGDRRWTSSRMIIPSANRFDGKVAVVTGGYGEIGSAICRILANGGATVYAAGRSEKRFEGVFESGGGVRFLELDVTDEGSIAEAFDQINVLDILVNCAGGSSRGEAALLKEQNIEVIDRMLTTNLRGCMLCSREASRRMAAVGRGAIVNVSSVIGRRGKKRFTDYAAAKAGVTGFTRSLALEMGQYGVRVNAVSPGFIQRGSFGKSQLDYNLSSNCLATVGSAEDVAAAVAFLASEEASFVTGQDLAVDGGRSLGLMGD